MNENQNQNSVVTAESLTDKTTTVSYTGCTITNIRCGSGARSHIIYGQIRSATGELLVSATLDYCVQALKERL